MGVSGLQQNYAAIKQRIAQACRSAGRDPSEVTLIAVSKTKPWEMISELVEAGHRDFGENYVQELQVKAQAAQSAGIRDLRWHFIGHLQSNKINALLPWVHSLHTLDSWKKAREVHVRWTREHAHKLPVFFEINLDAQATKAGMSPLDFKSEFSPLKLTEFPGFDFRGLMCIPDPEVSRHKSPEEAFNRLRELSRWARPYLGPELSMGMSQDFESAIACGATHVRVGSLLFGQR